jgi:hypothetical protein
LAGYFLRRIEFSVTKGRSLAARSSHPARRLYHVLGLYWATFTIDTSVRDSRAGVSDSLYHPTVNDDVLAGDERNPFLAHFPFRPLDWSGLIHPTFVRWPRIGVNVIIFAGEPERS